MDKKTDSYRTLSKPSAGVLFKEKKSKFYGYAFPIDNEESSKSILEELRKKHPAANHVCYAWLLGVHNTVYRVNDDGEPNNSAGMPIYGQIQAFNITNVLVAVVRIFGGVKLGVGGLITAYRTAAKMVLEASLIEERILQGQLSLAFDYAEMDKVMRIVKQNNLSVVSRRMELDCQFTISVRKSEQDKIKETFEGLRQVKVKTLR